MKFHLYYLEYRTIGIPQWIEIETYSAAREAIEAWVWMAAPHRWPGEYMIVRAWSIQGVLESSAHSPAGSPA